MTELSPSEAIERLVRGLVPLDDEQRIAPTAAFGRVLAADLVSNLDLPAFDNAAMDGYAVHADDLQRGRPLQVIGHAYAGHEFTGAASPGACVRITTGAPLPRATAAVVMQEDTCGDEAHRTLLHDCALGANIRRRGEHVGRGDVVLPRGRRLRAADLGLAASVGATRLAVRRPLRIGCLSTGDELEDPPAPLSPSAAYDANRPLMIACARRAGFDAQDLGICRDRTSDFEHSLAQAFAQGLDALVVSGGAAQGDADVVRQASGFDFMPLNVRPGRGVAFARLQRDGRRLLVLGLPGNAVACFVLFHLVAGPVLTHLAGGHAAVPTHVDVPLAVDVRVRAGRIDYRRARWVRGTAEPLPAQGSAMLRTVCDADLLLALGPDPLHAAGTCVPALLLDALG